MIADIYTYARRVAIAALVILLVVSGFYLLAWHGYFFLLVFAGILLAVAFCGMADWLMKKARLKRWLALLLAVLLLFGLLTAIFWFTAPTIGKQVKEMQETVPVALAQIEDWLSQYGWGRKLVDKVPDNLSSLLPQQKTLITRVSGVFSSSLSFLADFLIVVVTALYFAASPQLYTIGFSRLFPVRRRARVLQVLYMCYETLKTWLLSMLAAMLVTGIVSAIAYKLLGLPLAFALALLAFFGEFVQNIGPALAGIPAVLVGLTQSPQLALYVLLAYVGIQIVQSYVVAPLIFQRAVDMPPALLLFFQVLLGILQGGLGLLLAAPLLAVIMVVVKELYIKDVLDKADTADAPETASPTGPDGP